MATIHLLKISRLEGLTDGIFAIAMTILILNLHIPIQLDPNNLLPFIKQDILANLFIFIGSFIILGTHWVAMNFQIGLLDHLNRPYLWCHLFYLMTICIVPFSASLLGIYPKNIDSIYFYAINLLFASLGQLIILFAGIYFNLNKEISTPAIRRATLQRIFVAPPFYVVSIILSYWNITGAFILLVAPTLIYIIPGKIDKHESK